MIIGNHMGGDQKAKPLSLSYAQQLWDEWELQCLVLASFALQAFLLFAADIRKRNTSTVVRTLLWLAYVSADYIAVFVLGRLTLQINDPRHQLVLLWAPVLLLHLGGQETITAFSMQDIELWKRHLLGLVSQVALAVYVVAKSWRDRRLLAPVVLMFVSGTVKYAERTWALKTATPETIKGNSMSDLWKAMRKFEEDSRGKQVAMYNQDIVGRGKWWLQDKYADLVQAAGDTFPNCINVLADIPVASWVLPNIWDMVEEIVERDKPRTTQGAKDWFSPRAYKMGEIQLSLVYDHLYTKVGLRLRYVSLGLQLLTLCTTSSALALFATARKDGAYSGVDITVSYVLLAGAVTLEVLSILMATLSYRSYCFLRDRFGANRFTEAIFCLIKLVRPFHKPLWSNKWAQYNLIAGCIKEKKAGVITRMMRYVGLVGDTKFCRISDETKELICNELDDQYRLERFSHVRGQGILSLRGHLENSDLYKSIDKVDFSNSVVMWHIVTDICFLLTKGGGGGGRHMLLGREVSNYLMDLVIERRMMISVEGHLVHRKARDEVKEILAQHKEKINMDDTEAIRRMLEAGKNKISAAAGGAVPEGVDVVFARDATTGTMRPVLPRAWRLAQRLLEGGGDPWELIASVWMEMLFHLATRCEAGFHAKNLSTGGEFITHVRFLLHNRGIGWNFVLGHA